MRLADAPARVAPLRSLPPNKAVQRVRGGDGCYAYAEPAYDRHRQEAFQRRPTDEQAMTAQMNQTTWDDKP